MPSAARLGPKGGVPVFLVGDAHHTPFPDPPCLTTFSGMAPCHHLDLEGALSEIARVLKPGGKAVFQEPCITTRYFGRCGGSRPRPIRRTNGLSHWLISTCTKAVRALRHHEHFLFAVCAAPAHLLGKNFALSVIGALDRVDEQLMRLFPWLRRYAWLTAMEMEK